MTSSDTLITTVRIAAPPTVVFPYLVERPLLAQWIHVAADMVPEPGGVFAADFGAMVRGRFVSIDPPRRVVFTWGIPGSDVLPPGSTTVEIVLLADGQDTIVELTHRGLPPAEVASHTEGWASCLGGLVHAVEAQSVRP